MNNIPNISNIARATDRAMNLIGPLVHHTALVYSHYLSDILQAEVYLKCENEQFTGSFKARGSLNKILSLTPQERDKTIITASTGNHALGFARAIQLAGLRGRVFLPLSASEAKVKALSYYAVDLVRWGGDSLATELYAKKMADENHDIWVSPYNDLDIIQGQGTVGAEIFQDLENIDSILVTVGGGGLIAGIGSYFKYKSSDTKIIGCQPAHSPEMTMSIEAGEIVDFPDTQPTLSDGSAGGIEPGAITFPVCQEVIDECTLVVENDIKTGIRIIANYHKKIIEGSAGVAVASAIQLKEKLKGQRIVIVLCGANIDTHKFIEIMNE